MDSEKNTLERRLLLPLITAERVRHCAPMVADLTLVAHLQACADGHSPIFLPLDGSGAFNHASCGVAAHSGPTIAGIVTGLDQTLFVANAALCFNFALLLRKLRHQCLY